MHQQIKIDNKHLKNINKIEKYKKLKMMEHKTDMNITKIDKYKKKMSTMERKTEMNITKFGKTERHFQEGTHNRHEDY